MVWDYGCLSVFAWDDMIWDDAMIWDHTDDPVVSVVVVAPQIAPAMFSWGDGDKFWAKTHRMGGLPRFWTDPFASPALINLHVVLLKSIRR